jgi:hypothetical protein
MTSKAFFPRSRFAILAGQLVASRDERNSTDHAVILAAGGFVSLPARLEVGAVGGRVSKNFKLSHYPCRGSGVASWTKAAVWHASSGLAKPKSESDPNRQTASDSDKSHHEERLRQHGWLGEWTERQNHTCENESVSDNLRCHRVPLIPPIEITHRLMPSFYRLRQPTPALRSRWDTFRTNLEFNRVLLRQTDDERAKKPAAGGGFDLRTSSLRLSKRERCRRGNVRADIDALVMGSFAPAGTVPAVEKRF